MGEFGAVSVVSGHMRGRTNTLPLHVEILYNEYNFSAAFAVASLLALLALVTLVAESRAGVANPRVERQALRKEHGIWRLRRGTFSKTFADHGRRSAM